MDDEMETLHNRKVYTEVPQVKGRKTIGSRWVYAIKQDDQKKAPRFKARLVAQGYTQREGLDYFETYSPVIAFTLVRYFFVLLVVCLGWVHCHLDVKCAFLYGTLDEETYLRPPLGYGSSSGTTWRLHKALYGLHQSGRQWFAELDTTFQKLGFTKLQTTNCIYSFRKQAIILVYVDDIAIFAYNRAVLREVTNRIQSQYEVKILGEMRRFLGVEFTKKDGVWTMHQEQYIDGLSQHFDVHGARNVLIPLDPGTTLRENRNPEIGVDNTRYRSLIGAMMFLATRTRPDIMFAVIALAQFNANPAAEHWHLLQRVLKYTHSTKTLGIVCKCAPGEPVLTFYSDSSWASNLDDRKSWSGYVGLLSDVAVSWRAQKQRSIALSTMEAEFIGLTAAVMEIKWLVSISCEVPWIPMNRMPILYCDNDAAIAFAKDQREHQQSKHIDLRYKFIRNELTENLCVLKRVSTTENTADIFTKPLPRVPFERHRMVLVM
jgi:hypothetical protein